MKGKEYIRPMPATWWMHNRQVLLFMIRELTAVFVVGYAIFLMVLLYRIGQGPGSFHDFFESLKSPVSVVLHLLALLFVVYHSLTSWFAAPVLVVVYKG